MVMYMYLEGSIVEIQTPTHCNLIGRSLTAPTACFIAQQFSSVAFVSLHFHSRMKKFSAFQFLFKFLLFKKNSFKFEIAELAIA